MRIRPRQISYEQDIDFGGNGPEQQRAVTAGKAGQPGEIGAAALSVPATSRIRRWALCGPCLLDNQCAEAALSACSAELSGAL
jgi:hypothetical protein